MIVRMLDGFCCDNRNGLFVGAPLSGLHGAVVHDRHLGAVAQAQFGQD